MHTYVLCQFSNFIPICYAFPFLWSSAPITVIYYFDFIHRPYVFFAITTFRGMVLPSSSGEPTLLGPVDWARLHRWMTDKVQITDRNNTAQFSKTFGCEFCTHIHIDTFTCIQKLSHLLHVVSLVFWTQVRYTNSSHILLAFSVHILIMISLWIHFLFVNTFSNYPNTALLSETMK
jgi:hypothetical protein